MLESLLISACIFGNANSCQHSIQAYGKYTGLDKTVEEFGVKYPILAYTTSVAGVIKEQKMSFPLLFPNLLFSIEKENTVDTKNQLLWRYGF
jgi:hypothetical protein